ncbi:MAG: hypothetical protein ACQSGP_17125 [Frankia sp.]
MSEVESATKAIDLRRMATMEAGLRMTQSRDQARTASEALVEHDNRVAEHVDALRRAKEAVANHKAALKALTADRAQLVAAVNKAGKEEAKARRRAQRAQERYDRAVLAGLVAREKAADLTAHPAAAHRTPDRSVR